MANEKINDKNMEQASGGAYYTGAYYTGAVETTCNNCNTTFRIFEAEKRTVFEDLTGPNGYVFKQLCMQYKCPNCGEWCDA